MTFADPVRGWRVAGGASRPRQRAASATHRRVEAVSRRGRAGLASISICAAARCMFSSARTAPANRRSSISSAGTYPPDEGEFVYQGETIGRLTPHAARELGISPVFQEFSLAPELTVEQNLFLGRELTRGGVLDRSAMRAKAQRGHRSARLRSRPRPQGARPVARPSADGRDRQGLSRRRASCSSSTSPTASLTEAEAEKLFDLVAKLKASGRRHYLCLAPHARDQADRRPHHGVARRPQDHDGRTPPMSPRAISSN